MQFFFFAQWLFSVFCYNWTKVWKMSYESPCIFFYTGLHTHRNWLNVMLQEFTMNNCNGSWVNFNSSIMWRRRPKKGKKARKGPKKQKKNKKKNWTYQLNQLLRWDHLRNFLLVLGPRYIPAHWAKRPPHKAWTQRYKWPKTILPNPKGLWMANNAKLSIYGSYKNKKCIRNIALKIVNRNYFPPLNLRARVVGKIVSY